MLKKELLLRAVPLLMEWYNAQKRTLPWRGARDPYRVWVSEIMLQQTRVEAVKGYYSRFMERFPTARSLAEADEEEVLKYWEGLGYYSRARNLHRAAKIVAERGFPQTFEGVRALPGIGEYTAGAICSIAYGQPCPAVDGNVLRILTRLFADGSSIDDVAVRRKFSQLLKEVYPEEAGDFCQALMELGALVCIPNGEPMCLICPWRELCQARQAGQAEKYPVRAAKRDRKIVELNVYVLRRDGRYAIRKREGKGLLEGLWEFPNYEGEMTFGEILARKTAKHIFTHVEWHMKGYLVHAQTREAEEWSKEFLWVTGEELGSKYALPSAFKAFREWIK